jgi:hypothetical protein
MLTPVKRNLYHSVGSALLLFICCTVHSQNRIYYDEFFKSVSEKKTLYYRDLEESDTRIRITEMCGDTIMARGFINPGRHRLLTNDFAHFIKDYGNPYKFKTEFVSMRADIDYFKNGILERKFVSHSGKVFHGQVWSVDGKALLDHGTGQYVSNQNSATCYQYFSDSVMVEMFQVRDVEGDTVYFSYDTMAEPENGYAAFAQDLTKILKYPGFARLAGKEGIVYVQFIVSKDGRLTELKPLTDKGFNLEKKSVDRLSKMPKWKPAIFRGKPVKMMFTLPIRFKLV